ncbi:hypothetical protein SAMN04487786_3704 [Paenisporosarcina quisquiliarum]|nr:hypothetical protein SAMN04487786_3704 [Paenisporosarcina quisquiliarum]
MPQEHEEWINLKKDVGTERLILESLVCGGACPTV